MSHRLAPAALLALLLMPLAALPLAADDACGALAARIEQSPLATRLTSTFCRAAVAGGWLPQAEIDRITTAAELRKALRKDPLEAGNELFAMFERQADARPAATGWTSRVTEHYVFLARPGSAAADDLDLIAEQAEGTRRALAGTFGLEPLLAMHEPLLATKLPADAQIPDTATRIVIQLHARRADAGKAIGRNSQGATLFGATVQQGRGRLQLVAHVLYFNPLSLAVVQHEVAHLVVMLASANAPAIDKPIDSEAALRKAFGEAYRRLPAFLNEGIGDYGLYYSGVYAKWGLLGSPEALARAEKLPALQRLIDGDAMFHAREHKTFSLGAATFLRYLLDTQGPEPIRRWLQGSSFQASTNLRVADAESAWLKWLQTRN